MIAIRPSYLICGWGQYDKRQQMNGTTALHIVEVVGLFGLLAVVTGGIVIATKFILSFMGRITRN
jgi:hypothetical protein